MAIEIERKFLVADPQAAISAAESSERILQGYLSVNPDATVRVRLIGDRGRLTVKSRNRGCVRGEWEYDIPRADAAELLGLSVSAVIDKTRYRVPYGGHTWEVDIFTSPRSLALAEVEMLSADEEVILPPWLGPEVTSNPQYYNSTLSRISN